MMPLPDAWSVRRRECTTGGQPWDPSGAGATSADSDGAVSDADRDDPFERSPLPSAKYRDGPRLRPFSTSEAFFPKAAPVPLNPRGAWCDDGTWFESRSSTRACTAFPRAVCRRSRACGNRAGVGERQARRKVRDKEADARAFNSARDITVKSERRKEQRYNGANEVVMLPHVLTIWSRTS